MLKLVKTLAEIDPLTETSRPPLRLFIPSRKEWGKPGIKNCAFRKNESSLFSATIKMSTFFEIKLEIFLNLFQLSLYSGTKNCIFRVF